MGRCHLDSLTCQTYGDYGLEDASLATNLFRFRNRDTGDGIFERRGKLYVPFIDAGYRMNTLVLDIETEQWITAAEMRDPYPWSTASAADTFAVRWGRDRLLRIGRDTEGCRWSVWNLDTHRSVEPDGVPLPHRGRPQGLPMLFGATAPLGDAVAPVDDTHFIIWTSYTNQGMVHLCDVDGCEPLNSNYRVRASTFDPDAFNCTEQALCATRNALRTWRDPISGLPWAVYITRQNVNGVTFLPFPVRPQGLSRLYEDPATVVSGGTIGGAERDGVGSDARLTAPQGCSVHGNSLLYVTPFGALGSVDLRSNFTRVAVATGA